MGVSNAQLGCGGLLSWVRDFLVNFVGRIVITIRNSQGGGKPAVTRQRHSQGSPGVLVDPPFF